MNDELIKGPTTLNSDQLLQLEGYKEQTASWRHLDSMFHRFTSIILPVSIAALGVPYLNMGTEGTETEMPKWMPMAGGLALMIFWIISSETAEIRERIRFKIIHEIEKELGIKGHKEWTKRRNEKWTKRLRSHYLRRLMFVAYVVAVWGLLKYF